MKNSEIIQLYEALNRIEADKNLIFDLKTAYAMAYNESKLEQQVNIIYNLRRKILLKYGKSEDGNIKIPAENVDDCQRELEELMSFNPQINIMFLNIQDIEKYNFSLADMRGLQYMIQSTDNI